jgi:hypothetical protein
MRSIRLLLVPLLFAACTDTNPAAPDMDVSPSFAAADVGWIEGTAYDDYTAPVPCLGEDLLFTGYYWYRYHFVVNDKREIMTVLYGQEPDYRAAGMTTGQIWLPKPTLAQREVMVTPLGEPFQVYQTTATPYRLVNQTTGETLSFPLRVHVVRNAAGEVKVAFAVELCRVH